jgi:hypothetical protein
MGHAPPSTSAGILVTESLPHLDPMDVASYIDGRMNPAARAKLEAHIIDCESCRREIRDVDGIRRSAPASRSRVLLPLGALAAAAVALIVLLPAREVFTPEGTHRDPAVTATVAPKAIEPLGGVSAVKRMTWSSVPEANRYRVRIFDAQGAVIWEAEQADTTVGMPAGVRLVPGEKYFWSVSAKTGWGRSVESPLTEFVIPPGAPGR